MSVNTRMSAPTSTPRRRGAAGLSMIVLMVILQLVIVGAVVTGARDQDTTVQRVDSSRALYAAEAGTNMGVRELMANIDADGDGAIGTVSNDGNASNDPLFITANVYVSSSNAGGQTTLTAYARSNACRRRVATVAQAGSGGAGNATTLCAFSRNSVNTARYSVYSGGAWGTNTAFPNSLGGVATFVRCEPCPTRNEILMVTEDDQDDVNVQSYNGTAWSTPTEVCTGTGQNNYRACDVAYEAVSGSALIVYWNDSSARYCYRTWNGSAVSSETTMPALGSASSARWAALYARPSTNDIILLAHYTESGTAKLAANVWSSGGWGGWTTMTSSLESATSECFSLAYESLSGKAVAVYIENGQSQPRYRTWNGSSWSGQGTLATIGSTGKWVRMASDPTSNTILMVALDSSDDVEANVWDGSAWGSNTQLENDADGSSSRRVDVCFEHGTGRALVVYREKNKNRPQYRVWSGGSWGSESDGTNINRKVERVQVVSGSSDGEVLIACVDDQNDLHLMRWFNSAMSAATLIESDLGSGSSSCLPMCLVPAKAGASTPTIQSWAEVAPN